MCVRVALRNNITQKISPQAQSRLIEPVKVIRNYHCYRIDLAHTQQCPYIHFSFFLSFFLSCF